MRRWKEMFDRKRLELGWELYKNGEVLEICNDGFEITAHVQGCDEYEVNLKIVDGELLEFECNCPYGKQGFACKHMAAVLFEMEEGNKICCENRKLNHMKYQMRKKFQFYEIIGVIDAKYIDRWLNLMDYYLETIEKMMNQGKEKEALELLKILNSHVHQLEFLDDYGECDERMEMIYSYMQSLC